MKRAAKINNLGNPVERLLIKALKGAAALLREPENNNGSRNALLLGQADGLYRPKQKENIYLTRENRLRHTYILGATGTGKSKLLEFLIRQDILSGRGFCVVDPHGDLNQNILNFIAGILKTGNSQVTAERIRKKLVLIDPANSKWIVGFNPLEAGSIDPYMLVSEFMGIFKKLWKDAYSGPRMEELLRNTLLTLSLNNLTLLEAKALLTDPAFRLRLTEPLPAGEVKEYWFYRYNRLSERMQSVYREPILNRLSLFLSNPSIRLMVGQRKSTINFREIMDQGKWLLVNLSKGQLKGNARLLGALFIAKLQLTALARVDIPERKRTPFFLYADEFQNFLGEDFEIIISEARKYGLGLIMAHQNIDQLDRQLRSAILGNVLTQVFFRLSHQDASLLAAELGVREKPMIQRRLTELGPRQAYLKIKGEPARLMKTFYVPQAKSKPAAALTLKKLILPGCARARENIKKEIASRTQATESEPYLKKDPDIGRFAPQESFREGHGW